MSNFEDLWSLSQPILDDHFGELFTIAPQRKPDVNARGAADPSRFSQDFVGIWTDPHAVTSPPNRTGHPLGEGAKFGDDKPSIDFTTAALPYEVAIGDIITRQSNGARYAVSDAGTDGFTRSTVKLTAMVRRAVA